MTKHMIFGFLLIAVAGFPPAPECHAQSTSDAVQLFMPDGQLRSHLIRVHVNKDVREDASPGLVLHAPHTFLHEDLRESNTNHFYQLSRDYRWTQAVDGQAVEKRGTLLLFDLQNYPIPWYKAMTRITPILVWKDGDRAISVIGEKEVYLANTR